MSLAIFENFLKFAESAVAAKADLPPAIDANELESALVNYGVVLLHSHMEQCLRNALEARCVRCLDIELRTFALSIRDKEAGRIGIAALKETLKRFGDAYRGAFKQHLDSPGTGGGNSSWDSIQNQRARVAHHGQPATCSLADLRLYYEDIRRVLGFFCDALELNATEIAAVSNLIVSPAAPTT